MVLLSGDTYFKTFYPMSDYITGEDDEMTENDTNRAQRIEADTVKSESGAPTLEDRSHSSSERPESAVRSEQMKMAPKLLHKLKQKLALLSDSSGNIPLDEAVLDALPEGTQAQFAVSYGVSAWSFTAKITAVDSTGKPTSFFLKYVAGDLGKPQLEGEFVGMSALYNLASDFVPKPIAWGKLSDQTLATYFLITEFKHFMPVLPDAVKLGAKLAAMHLKSAWPNGKFGFHIQTYDGARIQYVGWEDSWTSFFSKLLAEAYRQDVETNGIWPELHTAYGRVQSHLLPRLIGALEADGRKVTPMLIHGDLWDGNIGVEADTGEPWIFDCAAYYAHNEMELGIWRAERHQMRAKAYRREYLRHCEPSEPEEEWDDRNLLYSAKTNFMLSAIFPGSPARRS
ncbi:hypothetical protein DL771_008820 [Monosporascus sp. 5C6A]|nr:hypothetical protein DL771_008820 [Monosporascus sp. 5C6A]